MRWHLISMMLAGDPHLPRGKCAWTFVPVALSPAPKRITFQKSYGIQGRYTAEAVKSLLKNPVNRTEVIRKTIEDLGGKLEGAWLSFGDSDVVLIAQMPDNVSVAAMALAVAASGAVHGKTTLLLTMEEGLAAMKKAGTSSYRPPGK